MKVVKPSKLKSEDKVRKECNKWLKDNGWIQFTMFTGGIPIFGGGYAVNPCKGFPDALVFNRRLKKLIYIEYKNSKGGILSIEQKDFHYLFRLCGQEVWVISSIKELKNKLESLENDSKLS